MACAPRMAFLVLGFALLACASGVRRGDGEVLRLSEVSGADATRRASLRLCLQGLDADAAGRPQAALGNYERAIQIDPTNPYAYLVLARHELDGGDATRALEYLDQAETRLASEGALSPGAEVHLAGMRGTALNELGRRGDPYLEEARRMSPSVWGDGRLESMELR